LYLSPHPFPTYREGAGVGYDKYSIMDINDPNRKLFPEFPEVSTKEWEEKILADLKGADYNKKLIWKTDEGFDVKPYYRSEDLIELEYLQQFSTDPVFSGEKAGNRWLIQQEIRCSDISEANRIAVDAIRRGADTVNICTAEITSHQQMTRLLENIDLTKTRISFMSSRSYPLTLELFCSEVNHRNCDPLKISGSLNFDFISYLLLHGDYYLTKENNLEEAEYLIRMIEKKIPGYRAITINGHYFREAGSSLVQELAFSLASGNEYLFELAKRDIPADLVASSLAFSFGTGPDYFLEIAKIRAARILWTKIVDQYSPDSEGSRRMFIHSKTILRNMTVYDPYVNMLRSSMEGMAAATGGADCISVSPFDLTFRNPDDFSDRVARNQQLILREESYLDKVKDPASGSYYIENLTHSLAKNAWDLFLKVEEKGGFLECIHSGFVQDEIEASAKRKEENVGSGKSVMVGVNQYPNLHESAPDTFHVQSAPDSDEAPSKYRKLKISRDVQALEMLRAATDRHIAGGNKRPAVFLLTAGNLTMRKARATFSTNFFGCGGYSILEDPHLATVEEGIEAALKSQAEIIVICSSDEEYAELAPKIAGGLKTKAPTVKVIVAGYPKEIVETLKQEGVDDFIHLRSNLTEVLTKYHQILGIIK
jgi:methylmalonyl-CoA mutase